MTKIEEIKQKIKAIEEEIKKIENAKIYFYQVINLGIEKMESCLLNEKNKKEEELKRIVEEEKNKKQINKQ